jgi:hypothetical protein
MNFPDIWATITGVAGIISLFLALNEKYANWKKFTLPICIGLVGFAIGRSTTIITPIAGHFSSKNLTTMVVVCSLLLVALAVFYIGMRYGQPGFAYASMFVLLIIAHEAKKQADS